MQRAETEDLRLPPFGARAKWDAIARGSREGARLDEMVLPSEQTMMQQTVQSMLEQAAELGITVPRGLRKKAKAEIARYIDEQLSK